MSQTTDTGLARAVIQEYVDACNAGSVERLRPIFHDDALITATKGTENTEKNDQDYS